MQLVAQGMATRLIQANIYTILAAKLSCIFTFICHHWLREMPPVCLILHNHTSYLSIYNLMVSYEMMNVLLSVVFTKAASLYVEKI